MITLYRILKRLALVALVPPVLLLFIQAIFREGDAGFLGIVLLVIPIAVGALAWIIKPTQAILEAAELAEFKATRVRQL